MKEKDVMLGVLWWDEVIAKCNQDTKGCQQLASEIMKIIDERETQKNNKKQTNKNRKH